MKKLFTKTAAALTAAALATALMGCSTPVTVTYDVDKPWHDGPASYERLDYDVTVYNTEAGTSYEQRVAIASGSLVHTLTEKTRTDGAVEYSELDVAFSVTYNDAAPEADRAKTDTVTSKTEFQTDSLVASRMTKTAELAQRGEEQNLSYTLTADYFGTHEAERLFTAKKDAAKEKLAIAQSTYFDNEMMYHLARATAIGANTATNFIMTNIFESFNAGELTSYTMVASGAQDPVTVELDRATFGSIVVRGEDEEEPPAEKTTYPVRCSCVGIRIRDDKNNRSGPTYYVYYAQPEFSIGGKKHKKVPVKITYAQYRGSKQIRETEYTLKSCAFEKQA